MVGAIGNSNSGLVGGLTPSVDAALSGRQEDFASVIARAKGTAELGGRDRSKAAREAAEQFVAQALVQPVLAQLRTTNRAAEPFAPTSGERTFQQMTDAQTAIALVRKTRWPMVDMVAQAIERRGMKA